MHKETKDWLAFLINDNRSAIKALSLKSLTENQEQFKWLRNQYLEDVLIDISELQSFLEQLKPFVLALKPKISDIVEESHICAAYLLLCSVLNEWESIFFLAKQGKYTSVMSLLRKIREALDTCQLFVLDFNEWERKNIDSWFSGKVIGNAVARKKMDEMLSDISCVDVNSLMSHVYQMESHVAHNGYVSMLEMVSPFTEDFDFDWPTGPHRTLSVLKSAKESMVYMIQCLRSLYIFVLKDWASEARLVQILNVCDPSVWKRDVPDNVKTIFGK